MGKIVKDLSNVTFSKIGTLIFEFGKIIVVSRWLGPEKNGLIAALTVYPILFMTIGSLGVRQATTYYVGKKTYSLESIKKCVVQLWFLSTLISTTSCYFLIRNFSGSGGNLTSVLLALVPIPFTLFNVYNSGIFLGSNNIKNFSKVDWLPSLFVFVSTFILVALFGLGINGYLCATILGPLIMSCVLFVKNDFSNSFSLKIEKKIFSSLLSMGAIFAFSNLIINLNYKSGIILLDKLSSNYELGIYSRGASITEYLWQIPMLFSSIIFARSANSKDGNLFSLKVIKILRLSLIAITICSILLVVFSDIIVSAFFGEKFLPSATILKILAPGVIMLTFFKILWVDLAGKGNTWDAMKAMIPALIANIIANFLLVPQFGATATAIASTISYTLASLIFLHIYSTRTEIPIRVILDFSWQDFEPLIDLINKTKNRFDTLILNK